MTEQRRGAKIRSQRPFAVDLVDVRAQCVIALHQIPQTLPADLHQLGPVAVAKHRERSRHAAERSDLAEKISAGHRLGAMLVEHTRQILEEYTHFFVLALACAYTRILP